MLKKRVLTTKKQIYGVITTHTVTNLLFACWLVFRAMLGNAWLINGSRE